MCCRIMLFMRIELRGLGEFCTTQMSSNRDNDPIQVYIRYKLKCQDYEMAQASATCPCLRVYTTPCDGRTTCLPAACPVCFKRTVYPNPCCPGRELAALPFLDYPSSAPPWSPCRYPDTLSQCHLEPSVQHCSLPPGAVKQQACAGLHL
jgi:hypothetical protein